MSGGGDGQMSLFYVQPAGEPATPKSAGGDLTAGERRRRRAAAAVAHGFHPLSLISAHHLRVHPDAERVLLGGTGPRCGTCAFRRMVGGHSRDYPKCLFPDPAGPWPRATKGEGTDVRAGWPACINYKPEATPKDPAPLDHKGSTE